MSGCTIKEAEKMPVLAATDGSKAGLGGGEGLLTDPFRLHRKPAGSCQRPGILGDARAGHTC